MVVWLFVSLYVSLYVCLYVCWSGWKGQRVIEVADAQGGDHSPLEEEEAQVPQQEPQRQRVPWVSVVLCLYLWMYLGVSVLFYVCFCMYFCVMFCAYLWKVFVLYSLS